VEAAVRREDLLNRSGLLVPRANERAAFYHLSFQEFLAAQRLTRTADDVERVFCEHRAVPKWRAMLLFLFAAQIANRDAEWGIRLLGRLLQDRTAVKASPAPGVFIAEAVELCLAKKYAVPNALREGFRRLALDAIEDEVELASRQALGLCLGRLGDPRIRSLRDPVAYVEVPAGGYPYGDKGEKIEIAVPLRIGRYPVTNGQFQEFIDTGGFREGFWWSEAGWKWLDQKGVTEPRWWRDRLQPAGGGGEFLGGRGMLRLGRGSAAERPGMGGHRPRSRGLHVPLGQRLAGRHLQHRRGQPRRHLAGWAVFSRAPSAAGHRGFDRQRLAQVEQWSGKSFFGTMGCAGRAGC
jgi:hypothetical protein